MEFRVHRIDIWNFC